MCIYIGILYSIVIYIYTVVILRLRICARPPCVESWADQGSHGNLMGFQQ